MKSPCKITGLQTEGYMLENGGEWRGWILFMYKAASHPDLRIQYYIQSTTHTPYPPHCLMFAEHIHTFSPQPLTNPGIRHTLGAKDSHTPLRCRRQSCHPKGPEQTTVVMWRPCPQPAYFPQHMARHCQLRTLPYLRIVLHKGF